MILNLIFFGPPGAGKGTVAQSISKSHNLIQVSTGNIIRKEVSSGSEFGLKLKGIIDAGNLVGDEAISEMLEKNLIELKSKPNFGGFIFDGFPRTVKQAELLDGILIRIKEKLSVVILIQSDEDVVVKRLSSRRTCSKCGKVYNLITMLPEVEGKCSCGGDLIQRDDDKEKIIRKRFEIYREKTEPLINYYEQKGLLKKYDGNVPPEESISRAKELIDSVKN